MGNFSEEFLGKGYFRGFWRIFRNDSGRRFEGISEGLRRFIWIIEAFLVVFQGHLRAFQRGYLSVLQVKSVLKSVLEVSRSLVCFK